jgi:hypothetical protein
MGSSARALSLPGFGEGRVGFFLPRSLALADPTSTFREAGEGAARRYFFNPAARAASFHFAASVTR